MPVIAPQQNRPAGTYTSSEVAAPARGQSQATNFIASLDLAAADLADSALVIDLTLEGSINNVNWTLYAQGTGWNGGMIDRAGNPIPPRVSWMASDNRVLSRMRLRWTQNKTARIGASLDFEAVDVNTSNT
jgi:hypothetical protein